MHLNTHTPPGNKIKLLSFNHLMKRSNFHDDDENAHIDIYVFFKKRQAISTCSLF